MAYPIAAGQLVKPARPKVRDTDTERALREIQAKLEELQDIVRGMAPRVP